MTRLLVHAGEPLGAATGETRFGGLPSAPHGVLGWPRCAACDSAMQFLGQLRDAGNDDLLLLFQCQDDPGMCEQWRADGGGNAVIAVPCASLEPVASPQEGRTTRAVRHGCRVVECPGEDYEKARRRWAALQDVDETQVLGQIGGEPAWLQDDETPDCTHCGRQMPLFAQLEEGVELCFQMNFGGGRAYVHRCGCGNAKMLWQPSCIEQE